uniref:Uncharacterized protein n=1 Tax=Oryza sativa subsp. japonica TaxID=39947 RepID=Q6K5M8_ORYSJ|nr:hypothetical protein [Oryza sativa Japonica Group]BAD22097.1 hypothetical protein [Oryza sativa Japonica Group]
MTKVAGRRWMKMESSPASEGNGASGVIGGNQAAAEERAALASTTAAVAWRSGGYSGGGARPEMGGGGAQGGEDVAGDGPYCTGDVGERWAATWARVASGVGARIRRETVAAWGGGAPAWAAGG